MSRYPQASSPPTHAKAGRSAVLVLTTLAVLVVPSIALGAPEEVSEVTAGAELFVAADGSDSGTGTAADPFRTLERARTAVRELAKDELPAGGIDVNLRGGVYERTSSFTLTEADSGTPASPVTYRAYQGEDVRIVGGNILAKDDFAPVTDGSVSERLPAASRDQVVAYDLKSHGITDYGEILQTGHGLPSEPALPELFVDDAAMTLSRFPNTGFERIGKVVDPGSNPRETGTGGPYTRPLPPVFDHGPTFQYADDRVEGWENTGDIWMYGYWYWDWADGNLRIESIDADKDSLTAESASQYSVRAGQRYYYYNVLEELDVPGEYYLDRTDGILYFYPPADFDDATVALTTQTDPLFHLDSASHVNVEGLTFELSRGDGVQIDGGTNNVVRDGLFHKLGGLGARVSGGVENGLEGNEIVHTGMGGLVLDGGDRNTLTPSLNFARHNVIHDYSRLALTYHPAITLRGVGAIAAHNEIHTGPHQAIAFAGNNHVIEYNDIHDVVQETDDAGAIYSARDWSSQGTVIRYNLLRDIGGPKAPGNAQYGIYLDDMISGTTAYGNILQNVPGAFLIGGGRANVIENNLIIDSSDGIRLGNRGENWASAACSEGGVLRTSLAAVPYKEEPWASAYPNLVNILEDQPCKPKYNVLQRNVLLRSANLNVVQTARDTGVVANNWVTTDDLGFIDYVGGDWRLEKDSPVYDKVPGFTPVPADQIGVGRGALDIGLDGWAGTKNPSTEQVHSGVSSHAVVADQEVLTRFTADASDGTVSMWFYDDSTNTGLAVVGNVPTAVDNGWRAIGVNTNQSSSHYVTRVDNTWRVTDAPRITGWHEFTWRYENGVDLVMALDGVTVESVPDSDSFNTISLGDWWKDGLRGQVYFDDMSITPTGPNPTPTATSEPTATATSEPTATATSEPTVTATSEPTVTATTEPTATATATAEPTGTASTVPAPTATTTVTATVTATTSTAPNWQGGDVYSKPGYHLVNGRTWFTACEEYSQTVRCRTDIWSTQVHYKGNGKFEQRTGWNFNNLTYLPSPRSLWKNNPLGETGQWSAVDGRKWRTECDTAATGGNGCRSYIWTTNKGASKKNPDGNWSHHLVDEWVFNNIVKFS